MPKRDLAEAAGQPGITSAGGAATFAAGGVVVDRGELRPRHQVRGVGESGRVHADLGDQLLGGRLADPGDLIEPLDVMGERGDHVLDPGAEGLDLRGQRVDVIQHRLHQEPVVVFEVHRSRGVRDEVLCYL